MTAEETSLRNAFETTLTSAMAATDLSAVVTSLGGLTSPCILVIEPDSDSRREFVRFDGTFTGSSFVTTTINNRYLSGSAAGSGITHPVGSVVASVATQQHIEDIHDRIDALAADYSTLDHGVNLTGLADDDHPQYHNDARGDVRYAKLADFNSHLGGIATTDHPEASTTTRGFMSAADKVKLNNIETGATTDQTITAGGGLTGGGSGNVTLSHANTSSAASKNNSGATVIQDVTVDTYGHVTAMGSKTLTYSDVGAAAYSHTHSYVPLAGGTAMWGTLELYGGTTTSVGVAFDGDTNTGWIYGGNGRWEWVSNGTTRLLLQENGLAYSANTYSAQPVVDAFQIEADSSHAALQTYRHTATSNDHVLQVYSDVGSTKTRQWIVDSDGDTLKLSDPTMKQAMTPARSYWDDFRSLHDSGAIIRHQWKDSTDGKVLTNWDASKVSAVFPKLAERHYESDEDPDEAEGRLMINESALNIIASKVLMEAQARIEALEARLETGGAK